MITYGKRIAVVPPPSTSIKTSFKGGVALIEDLNKPLKLQVVYANDGNDLKVAPGDYVYVDGRCIKHPWAKEKMIAEDGTEFVLCPVDQVIGYDRGHDRPIK